MALEELFVLVVVGLRAMERLWEEPAPVHQLEVAASVATASTGSPPLG